MPEIAHVMIELSLFLSLRAPLQRERLRRLSPFNDGIKLTLTKSVPVPHKIHTKVIACHIG